VGPVKYEWSEELRGPDVIPKDKRWESKGYLHFVKNLPCANCKIEDGTIVPHHLKHRLSPFSGGAGYKASDWLAMPLCSKCHRDAHNGDRDILDWQHVFIFATLRLAFRQGILGFLK